MLYLAVIYLPYINIFATLELINHLCAILLLQLLIIGLYNKFTLKVSNFDSLSVSTLISSRIQLIINDFVTSLEYFQKVSTGCPAIAKVGG